MRKALLALAAAGALVAGILGAATPSQALGLVDLGTTVASNPGTVSPPGELVRYTVTYSNTPDSLLTGTGTATDTTSGGGKLVEVVGAPSNCTIPAAGTVNPTISCPVSLAPGASFSFAVVIASPLNGDDLTNTSTVTASPDLLGVIPDTNTTNNTASVLTPVTGNTLVASAFLRDGDSLAFRNHLMTVIDTFGSAEGIIATMKDSVVAPGTMCGATACDPEGLNYDFDDREEYQGRVSIDVNFVGDDPCFGYGNNSCHLLFYRLFDKVTGLPKPPAEIASCGASGPVGEVPCLSGLRKVNNGFVWTVLANTDDPDLLTTITGMTK